MIHPAPNRGRFITLEGIEGSGKTSCLSLIEAHLKDQGIPLISTREPGGTALAEEIRHLLLAHRQENMSHDTELLLMFAARSEHLARLIQPALAAGTWVICSRFTDSTYAYQGGGRGLSLNKIETLEKFVHESLQPDLTFLLDLPAEIGLQRARARAELDRIESEEIAFFERVRTAYLNRAKRESRYRIINTQKALSQVQADILHHLKEFI